jgi:hypothetical protein
VLRRRSIAWALSSCNGYNMRFYDDVQNWAPRANALGINASRHSHLMSAKPGELQYVR